MADWVNIHPCHTTKALKPSQITSPGKYCHRRQRSGRRDKCASIRKCAFSFVAKQAPQYNNQVKEKMASSSVLCVKEVKMVS